MNLLLVSAHHSLWPRPDICRSTERRTCSRVSPSPTAPRPFVSSSPTVPRRPVDYYYVIYEFRAYPDQEDIEVKIELFVPSSSSYGL